MSTARAYPNIALIKYWGKADEELMLPAAGSLSLTLDTFATTTTVTLVPEADDDSLELNGAEATPEQVRRVTRLLDIVREWSGSTAHARVVTRNEAPTGAGLASSASGFAALATAAADAYGLDLSARDLSRLARRGSGSATRSIFPGLAMWHAGDDESSCAEDVSGPDFRMIIVFVDESHKSVTSREAMRRTAATSPFHSAWVESTAQSLDLALQACADDDFTRLGQLTESNALRMHAVIQSAEPPIRYLTARSIAVFDAVERLREDGLEAYATADAGPNVVVISRPADADAVAERLGDLGRVAVVGPGPGAALISEE
ncbi:diphosphomevalonate decarboxylase [uncultured Microbacterium sp.]|uniref:diphosphomevalonate decarboxylase n=1 Tax=uncultured Microbacterium sp. TaxID=191216 RepID=UPI00262885EB|nr:diphosphomevalonate decarboxylase [uncultured Microbacterium sp.]